MQLDLGLVPAITIPQRLQSHMRPWRRIEGGGSRYDRRVHRSSQRGLTFMQFSVGNADKARRRSVERFTV